MPYRSIPLVLFWAVAACGTVHEEKPAPAMPPPLVLEGWRDVAGGRMGPDGLFYSETGRFFAAFPGMPEHHSKDIESQTGRLRMESYVYEESATTAYMVAYTDYPVKHVERLGWEDFLLQAQAGIIRSLEVDGEVKEKPVLINGHHGSSFRCNGRNGMHVVSQILLVGNRLYQCTILTEGSYPADVIVDQFFKGFHLVFPGQEVVATDTSTWFDPLDTLGASKAR
jgi:hypothetical protein